MKRVFEVICDLLILVGLFVLLGTAGAFDFELLSNLEFIGQSSIGLIMMILGAIGLEKGGKDYV